MYMIISLQSGLRYTSKFLSMENHRCICGINIHLASFEGFSNINQKCFVWFVSSVLWSSSTEFYVVLGKISLAPSLNLIGRTPKNTRLNQNLFRLLQLNNFAWNVWQFKFFTEFQIIFNRNNHIYIYYWNS